MHLDALSRGFAEDGGIGPSTKSLRQRACQAEPSAGQYGPHDGLDGIPLLPPLPSPPTTFGPTDHRAAAVVGGVLSFDEDELAIAAMIELHGVLGHSPRHHRGNVWKRETKVKSLA